jgi:hypothetical protein
MIVREFVVILSVILILLTHGIESFPQGIEMGMNYNGFLGGYGKRNNHFIQPNPKMFYQQPNDELEMSKFGNRMNWEALNDQTNENDDEVQDEAQDDPVSAPFNMQNMPAMPGTNINMNEMMNTIMGQVYAQMMKYFKNPAMNG